MAERYLCIYLPAFMLQVESLREPEEKAIPAVIVESEKPSARVVEVSESARRAGVRRGMRYGDVLSFVPQLRAHVYEAARIQAAMDALAQALEAYSPLVETQSAFPGIFWLQGRGLASLWASASAWTSAVDAMLKIRGYEAAVVCGYSRFGTSAVARALRTGMRIFASQDEERLWVDKVPLDASGLPATVRDDFERLGVRTMGALRGLPVSSVQLRYGEATAAWLRLAREELPIEQRVWSAPPTYQAEADFEFPITETTSLLFRVRALLEDVCAKLESRNYCAGEMTLTLTLDWPKRPDERLMKEAALAGIPLHEAVTISLKPAHVTAELHVWVELFRLRFERLILPVGAKHALLEAQSSRPEHEQLSVGLGNTRPDATRMLDALAKIRAEFGDDSVGVMELRSAHLPEARQGWSTVKDLPPPAPKLDASLTLARRLLPKAIEAKAPRSAQADPQQALIEAMRWMGYGEILRMSGPWVISGAWWRKEVIRASYYLTLSSGAILWIYWDEVRKRWFIQGDVG